MCTRRMRGGVVGEPAAAAPNSKLRDYLYGELVDFVESILNTCADAGDIALAEYTLQHHRCRLDALRDDEEVRHISRDDLPDWHSQSMAQHGGSPYDRFTLTADDELVPEEPTPPPRPLPNRAQRRAAGWRGPWLNGNGQDGQR